MLVLQERRTLHRLRAARQDVQRIDLSARKPQLLEQVETRVSLRGLDINTDPLEQVIAQRPRRKREAQLEHPRQRVLDLAEVGLVEAL